MPEHPNATVAREMNEAMQRDDLDTAAKYVADDVVWHIIGRKEPYRGKSELASSMGGFPSDVQVKWEVHDLLASDDHVVSIGTAVATKGSGSLTYRVAEVYHIRDGQVTERWALSDDTQAITDFFG